MKIIKRNGSEETFDIQKIVVAVTKADKDNGERTLTDSQIEDIAEYGFCKQQQQAFEA